MTCRDAAQPGLGRSCSTTCRAARGRRRQRAAAGLRGGRRCRSACSSRSSAVAVPRPADRGAVQRRPDDRQPAADHDRGRRAGPGPQLYGQAAPESRLRDPRADARPGPDVGLRPQPLHARLSRRRAERRRAVRLARRVHGADRAAVRAGRAAARRRWRIQPVARRDLPVALAARHLRLFRGDGDPRHRASRRSECGLGDAEHRRRCSRA